MGQNTTDATGLILICSTTEEPYGFTTELGGTLTAFPCTQTEWIACVDKAGNSSQFDTKMSTVFGDDWDDVPDTGSDPGKDVVRAAFNGVRLAYA